MTHQLEVDEVQWEHDVSKHVIDSSENSFILQLLLPCPDVLPSCPQPRAKWVTDFHLSKIEYVLDKRKSSRLKRVLVIKYAIITLKEKIQLLKTNAKHYPFNVGKRRCGCHILMMFEGLFLPFFSYNLFPLLLFILLCHSYWLETPIVSWVKSETSHCTWRGKFKHL